MMRALVLALLAMLPATAHCSPWKRPPVTINRAGERLCAKHHQQLERITVYGPGNGVCILFQPNRATARARAASPNPLPLGIQRTRSQLYSQAAWVSYCKSCEADVMAAIRK